MLRILHKTELLSMAAHSSKQREEWEKVILGFLWAGDVGNAAAFLGSIAERREKAKDDLLGCLTKHESEIIDYGRRQTAGKVIGSGRMEKVVDQVIGVRQKNWGMSWTKQGIRARAVLTVAILNAPFPTYA